MCLYVFDARWWNWCSVCTWHYHVLLVSASSSLCESYQIFSLFLIYGYSFPTCAFWDHLEYLHFFTGCYLRGFLDHSIKMSDICTAGTTVCNDGRISRASLDKSNSSVICCPCMFIVICGKCKFPTEEAQESTLENRNIQFSAFFPQPLLSGQHGSNKA